MRHLIYWQVKKNHLGWIELFVELLLEKEGEYSQYNSNRLLTYSVTEFLAYFENLLPVFYTFSYRNKTINAITNIRNCK